MVKKMESALEILSRAADMVGNASAQILKQALIKRSPNSQRKQANNDIIENNKRNSNDADDESSPPLEEPLDMSIKSRKRHTPENGYNLVKKHRPSVIYYGRGGNTRSSSSSDEDVQSSGCNGNKPVIGTSDDPKNNGPQWEKEEAAPRRVIITHDVNDDGGLEEHFRRSLSKDYSKEADAQQGVDAHFSRSLGSAAWKEIQRVASIKKDTPVPKSPEPDSPIDTAEPVPKSEEEEVAENVESVTGKH